MLVNVLSVDMILSVIVMLVVLVSMEVQATLRTPPMRRKMTMTMFKK